MNSMIIKNILGGDRVKCVRMDSRHKCRPLLTEWTWAGHTLTSEQPRYPDEAGRH